MIKIILASKSPLRKMLLKKAGIKFDIVESNLEERIDPKLSAQKNAENLSLEKAKAVFSKYPDSIIIAADTLINCNGNILGKPKDEEDAIKMITQLSNKTHTIITGFTLIISTKIITSSENTKITMKNITKKEIEDYIKTKEYLGKAGAYAIQGIARKFVTKIEGDLDNAIGFPTRKIKKYLSDLI